MRELPHAPNRARHARPVRPAFTLIEILIVVIILGILAAIVIPQFANATSDARAANLGQQVQMLKHQVALYRAQHFDAVPDLITSWDPLTKPSDASGNTANPSGPTFGPYLPGPIVNPFTSSTVVAATPSTSAGWVYDNTTGEIHGITAQGDKTDDGATVIP